MDSFYKYINLFPMPLWLAMMFAPNHPVTKRASRSSTVFGLAAVHYVLSLLLAIWTGRQNNSDDDNDQPALDFTTLDGISRGLGTRSGALGAWSHMLALDLFTGAWIYRQAQVLNAPAWVRIPALFFTLMTGPFGLLLFLIWRIVGAGKQETI